MQVHDKIWARNELTHGVASRLRAPQAGLYLNGVRVFVNACSCSVLCSVFKPERVRDPCSGLNVFGHLGPICCVRCSGLHVVLCSMFGSAVYADRSEGYMLIGVRGIC